MTAGRWPWKSEPAKECVTTHLPKLPALKMDDAKALTLYPARCIVRWIYLVYRSRKVVSVAQTVLEVILAVAAGSADLGGSSK